MIYTKSGHSGVIDYQLALFVLATTAVLLLSSRADASWLSKITGIHVDLNRGRVSIDKPDVGAIPQMLRNLPKDVGQAMLNPAGTALAAAIRSSRAGSQ